MVLIEQAVAAVVVIERLQIKRLTQDKYLRLLWELVGQAAFLELLQVIRSKRAAKEMMPFFQRRLLVPHLLIP